MSNHRRRFRRWIVPAALVGALAIGAGFYVSAWPPAPRGLDDFDPLVAEAIRAALRPARLQPWSVQARLDLGMVYEANDEFDLACQCYRRVLRSRPDDARVWYRVACASEQTGALDDAFAAIDRAIALELHHAPLHWRRGMWLMDR